MGSTSLVNEILGHAATPYMHTFQTFIYICVCVLCNIHLLLIDLLRTAYETDLIWRWCSYSRHILSWKEALKVQMCTATFMIHAWLNSAVCKNVGKHIEHVNFGLHNTTF